MLKVESLISNIPIIKINLPNNNQLYVLMEKYNLTGSIKVKPVYYILKSAIENKILKEGDTVIEASSGNTAIALSYLSRIFNLKTIIVLPSSTSKCKKRLIRSYNAEIIEINGTTDDCIEVRDKIAAEHPEYFILNQFKDENNLKSHYFLTGQYLYEKLVIENKIKINFFASGLGTSGTLLGSGKYFKEKNNDIKIIGFNPVEKVEGLRNFKSTKIKIPFFEKYKYLIDQIIDVDFMDSIKGIKIFMKEGYFVGISSGAIISGVLKYLKDKSDQIGVTVAPDGGDNYLDVISNYIDLSDLRMCK